MNAYFVDAGVIQGSTGHIGDSPPYTERLCGIYVAETPGRAKAMLIRDHRRDLDDIRSIKHCWRIGRQLSGYTPGKCEDQELWDEVSKREKARRVKRATQALNAAVVHYDLDAETIKRIAEDEDTYYADED